MLKREIGHSARSNDFAFAHTVLVVLCGVLFGAGLAGLYEDSKPIPQVRLNVIHTKCGEGYELTYDNKYWVCRPRALEIEQRGFGYSPGITHTRSFQINDGTGTGPANTIMFADGVSKTTTFSGDVVIKGRLIYDRR